MKNIKDNSIKKKKVLFLIHTLQVGGAEKVLVNLVNNMDSEKFDITVMTVVDAGAFRNDLNSNIKYDSILRTDFLKRKKQNNTASKKSGNLLDKAGFMKNIAAKLYQYFWRHTDCSKVYKKKIKEKYDIEVAFLEGITTKIIANSTNKESKKIAWVHVDLINERKSEKFYKSKNEEKETYKAFDEIVCVSNSVREQIIKKLNIKEDKTIVKYNPIDSGVIEKKSEEKGLDCEKRKFTLCAVGRLSPQKAFDRLINCMNKLVHDGIDVDLWIIGVGAEEQKLKNMIQEYNLKNVQLLGYQSNPYKYIRAADLFVCSSIAEGFSTVVSEAVILEKPIVTTDCSGMKEILGEGNKCGLITGNNEEALYIGLREVLTNTNMVERYSKSVSKRKKIFDLKNSVKGIEMMFLESKEKAA